MTTYDGKKFFKVYDRNSGAVFQDMAFTNCIFDNCALSLTKTPDLRSTVRNVRLANCSVVNCGVRSAVFEDVVVDGLNTNRLLPFWGPLFKHVTLKGKIGQLKITLLGDFWARDSEMQRPFDLARSRFYETVDWALDISAAHFTLFELEGVPARLVRRKYSGRVGMGVASHPSHRSVLAQLRHTARQATDSLREVMLAHAATAAAVPSASRSTAPR